MTRHYTATARTIPWIATGWRANLNQTAFLSVAVKGYCTAEHYSQLAAGSFNFIFDVRRWTFDVERSSFKYLPKAKFNDIGL